MDREKWRRALPFVAAFLFFTLSFSRGAGLRGAYLGLGVIFLIIGIRRRRAAV